MLFTIGYTFIEDLEHPCRQVASALFFNEPDLTHLSWMGTVIQKSDNLEEASQLCKEQLQNYIRYYNGNSLCIIGGDWSTLKTTCETLDHPNCVLLSRTPEEIIDAISPLCEKIFLPPEKQISVDLVCIDARNLQHSDLEYLPHCPGVVVILNYDYTTDSAEQDFSIVKKYLHKLKP